MMSKIDLHQYQTVQDFLDDIELICRNALEYNPDKDPQSKYMYMGDTLQNLRHVDFPALPVEHQIMTCFFRSLSLLSRSLLSVLSLFVYPCFPFVTSSVHVP